MRIGVSGTQCIGKSTFLQDFLKAWPMYKTDTKKYTDYAKEKGLKLNKEGNEESQMFILNFLCDQIVGQSKDTNLILDRTVLDNLVYTMWLNANDKVPNSFVKKTIDIVRETLPFYDIIFFFPITKYSPVNIEKAEHREINPIYRQEIDVLFKALMDRYGKHDLVYFPIDHKLGCPALIEIIGNREERIQLTKMYLTPDGTTFGNEDTLLTDANINKDTNLLM